MIRFLNWLSFKFVLRSLFKKNGFNTKYHSHKDRTVEIKESEVYTPQEIQEILKLSPSTVTRLIKKGLIRTARVGKQYRILGKELLRLLSPEFEDRAGNAYDKARQWVHKGIDP
jgi:excisionase family DNA binding protein